MDGTTRVTLASVLHPVRQAATHITDQPEPSLDETLQALEALRVEAARAETLVRRLADPDQAL